MNNKGIAPCSLCFFVKLTGRPRRALGWKGGGACEVRNESLGPTEQCEADSQSKHYRA